MRPDNLQILESDFLPNIEVQKLKEMGLLSEQAFPI